MELMEAIKGRRSVRKFKPDPIPKEDLEEIIQAGLCAPSAQNSVLLVLGIGNYRVFSPQGA